jgi:hypothetical protein
VTDATRELARVNCALRTVAGSRTLPRATDEADLLAAMCRVITLYPGRRRTWPDRDQRYGIGSLRARHLELGQFNEIKKVLGYSCREELLELVRRVATIIWARAVLARPLVSGAICGVEALVRWQHPQDAMSRRGI